MKTPCSKSPRRCSPTRVLLTLGLLLLVSCQKEAPAPTYRVIGEAFAGPNELPLRQDVSLRSPVAGTVAHGEKLDILDRRRRFLQVRTRSGLIGWVDIRLLISAKQMDQLADMAARYKDAPSMGRATVFDMLNVHTDANRYSPTFLQLQENEKFDVIGNRVVARVPYHGESIEIEDSRPRPNARKPRPKKEPKIPPPPAPPAPAPPENWLELSRSSVKNAEGKPAPTQQMDELSLIRTKDGRVGWVIANAVFLEVPDEVAQYAEGQRITAYFPLGQVTSGGVQYNHWLWTTKSVKFAPYEFDGFRVFTYNTRRNRYETAYRERNLRGFFPVLVNGMNFSVVVEDAEGQTIEKSFAFDGTRVRSLGRKPYTPADNQAPVSTRSTPLPDTDGSWWDRIKRLLPGRD